MAKNSPAAFVCEPVSHRAHDSANLGPVNAADYAEVFDGDDGVEQVAVGTLGPGFVVNHLGVVDVEILWHQSW